MASMRRTSPLTFLAEIIRYWGTILIRTCLRIYQKEITLPTPNKEQNASHQRAYRDRMTPEARKEYDHQRYIRNRGKYRVRSKKWQQENHEHCQAASHNATVKRKYPEAFAQGDINNQTLTTWLKEYKGRLCKYCDEPGTHIDHKVALSDGGEHKFLNIQITCEFCNLAKNNLSEYKFLQKIKQIFYNREELSGI